MLLLASSMADNIVESWRNLRISDEEEQIVSFAKGEESNPAISKQVELLLVGRLINGKSVNLKGFRNSVVGLWRLTGEVVLREISGNLLAIQLSTQKDKNRILQRRPWFFDNQLFLIEEIGQNQQPSEVNFSKSPFWVHLLDVPFALRDQQSTNLLGQALGGILEIDDDDPLHLDPMVRIKITLDITRPLRRGLRVELPNGDQKWLRIQYERLPLLCYWCGHLGHSDYFCAEKPSDIPKSVEMPYGDWLRASPRPRKSRGDLAESLRIKKLLDFSDGNTRSVREVSGSSERWAKFLSNMFALKNKGTLVDNSKTTSSEHGLPSNEKSPLVQKTLPMIVQSAHPHGTQTELGKDASSDSITPISSTQASPGLDAIKEGNAEGIKDGYLSSKDETRLVLENLVEVPVQNTTEALALYTSSLKKAPKIFKPKRQGTGKPTDNEPQNVTKRKREDISLKDDSDRIQKRQHSSSCDDNLERPRQVVTLDLNQGHEQQ